MWIGAFSLLNSEWIHSRNNFGVEALSLVTDYWLQCFAAKIPWLILKPQELHQFFLSSCPRAINNISKCLFVSFYLILLSQVPKNFCVLFIPSYVNYRSWSYIDSHDPYTQHMTVNLCSFTWSLCFLKLSTISSICKSVLFPSPACGLAQILTHKCIFQPMFFVSDHI